MKKILSVALSTAMAFSMFASVAFGADAKLTPEQQFNALKDAGIVSGFPDGLSHLEKTLTRAELAKIIVNSLSLEPVDATSYNDKNYAKHWGRTYIEAATQAGILNGKDAAKKLFDPNGAVTVQELAKVLVTALKLEVPADANNTASAWAKGYVAAAVNAGYLADGINYQAQATRSQAVVAAYAIYEAAQVPTVKSYKVVDSKNVEFTLSTDEVVKVTLEKALEANKETEVTFKTKDGVEIKTTVKWEVTTATKVASVSATNLKEVTVKFDGKVDKDSAENVANYSLRSGKVIDSVTLAADETTATLLLKDSPLNNNKVDAVSVSNVKAGSATVSATNVEFTAVDNALPEVSSVASLGTKSVKVVFSEPVRTPNQVNFNLDGKEFFGKVTPSNNFKTIVLTPYNTSALAVGDHKLTVSGVKDYADFVSLASSHDFTVVEDKAAPTIAEATATLESVTITFSEDVDVDTVDHNKVYWKSGSNKITAVSKKQLADNKWQFVFGASKSLPTGSVSIFVEGVKDYSGNAIAADTSVVVTPTIDQTRPEVSAVTAENARKIKITFTKAVDLTSAETEANYSVKDKDGKTITVKQALRDTTNLKVVYVDLYTDLSATGENTLTIQNVKDDTKLQNTILDYTGKVVLADKTAPKMESKTVSVAERRLVIKFDEKMDIDTLANYSNYLVQIDNNFQPLTSSIAEITPFQDGTAVSIKFAESIGGKLVRLASNAGATGYTHINALTVLGVKDANGNVLYEFTQGGTVNKIDVTSNTVVGLDGKAELVDRKTVKVKFNAGISNYSAGAFVNTGVGAPAVDSVEVDGTSTVKVKFATELKTDGSDLNLAIDLSKLVTNAGNAPTGSATVNTSNLKDSVAPVALKPDNNTAVYPFPAAGPNSFVITFSENVRSASDALAASAFKVYRNTDNKELKATDGDFSVSVVNNTITFTVNDSATRTENTAYRVETSGANTVTDASAERNVLESFNGISVALTGTAAPTLTKTDATYALNNDGVISGLDATKVYEYKLASAPTWTAVTAGQTQIIGLAAGTYEVRVAAIAPVVGPPAVPGVPAGAIATVTIARTVTTDADAVASAIDALTTLSVTDPAGAATIALPSTGANGTAIAWTYAINAGAATAVSTSYSPVRPVAPGPDTIVFTATVTKGAATPVTKAFTVTVPVTGAVTVAP